LLADDAEARLRFDAYDYLEIFDEDAGRYGARGVACSIDDALRSRAQYVVRPIWGHEQA